ncbi:hypothetical protein RRG08_040564 [Elysia crispata]|uniref:C2H2-type domain-containing protein n=1 Tax=Elysia crispata TaxID=231223 RepID=A0AAE0Z812_9GAST|nr:hypothetical protein RRG08_040564 [Elysia crispata]
MQPRHTGATRYRQLQPDIDNRNSRHAEAATTMEHTCGTCERQFRRKAELDRHTKRQTPCKPPAYTCSRCGKGFASYQTLWRHKKTLHGEQAQTPRVADIATEQVQTLRAAVEHPETPRVADTAAECEAQDQQAECVAQDQQGEDNAAILRDCIEHTQADTDRILELEAAYDDLAELQRATIRKLLERDAEAERAKDDAKQARSMALESLEVLEERLWRIATLESQNEQLRESLAEAQSARLVLSEQQENRPADTRVGKKRARGKKK